MGFQFAVDLGSQKPQRAKTWMMGELLYHKFSLKFKNSSLASDAKPKLI